MLSFNKAVFPARLFLFDVFHERFFACLRIKSMSATAILYEMDENSAQEVSQDNNSS
jgi:hypothetical protein